MGRGRVRAQLVKKSMLIRHRIVTRGTVTLTGVSWLGRARPIVTPDPLRIAAGPHPDLHGSQPELLVEDRRTSPITVQNRPGTPWRRTSQKVEGNGDRGGQTEEPTSGVRSRLFCRSHLARGVPDVW